MALLENPFVPTRINIGPVETQSPALEKFSFLTVTIRWLVNELAMLGHLTSSIRR
jgi:hypothetical protein